MFRFNIPAGIFSFAGFTLRSMLGELVFLFLTRRINRSFSTSMRSLKTQEAKE